MFKSVGVVLTILALPLTGLEEGKIMDVVTQLLDEKTELLERIAEAAKRGDSQEVLARGEKLEKLESLICRYENLVRDISSLDPRGSGPSVVSPLPEHRGTQNGRERKGRHSTSGKGVGKTIRSAFLEGLSEKGIQLRQIKGTIYETQSGQRIGIAVATERKPDRWFLGLPLGGAIMRFCSVSAKRAKFWNSGCQRVFLTITATA